MLRAIKDTSAKLSISAVDMQAQCETQINNRDSISHQYFEIILHF